MAIAFDAASTFSPAVASSSQTFSHTASGADRILVVATGVTGTTNAVSGVTYNTVALTKLNHSEDAGDARVELWYLVAPDTGTHDVVVTMAASSRVCGGAASYTGVDQTVPWGTDSGANSNNVASLEATVAVASAAGELVVAANSRRANEVATAGAGSTERFAADCTAGVDPGSCELLDEAGAASVTVNWTWTTTNRRWAILGAPLKPSGAAAVTPKKLASLGVG